MQFKTWQLVVIVIGLVGGIGSIAWNVVGKETLDIPHSMTMIDVEDGTIYTVNLDANGADMPAKSPVSGKYSLVRLVKDEAGHYSISDRDRLVLKHMDQGITVIAVDPETGALKKPPTGSPVAWKIKP